MSSKPVVWICEPNADTQKQLESLFGFRYELVFFGSLGALLAQSRDGKRPDLIVTELSCPDGFLLDRTTSEGLLPFNGTPVLVISASDDLDAMRRCFECGASEFVLKPFSRHEMILRTERLLSAKSRAIALDGSGPLRLDSLLRTLQVNGKATVSLTPKETQVITMLLRTPGGWISRSSLQNTLWPDVRVGPKVLDVHVRNLNRKLTASGVGVSIAIRGRDRIEISMQSLRPT